MKRFFPFAAALLFLAACQQPESAAEDFPNLKPPVLKTSLKGPTWILEAISTDSQYEALSDSSVRMVFLDSGRAQLKGCNFCGASYSTVGDSVIHFSSGTCTEMACRSQTLTQGDSLIGWLTALPLSYRLSSSGLSLRRDSIEFHFYDSALVD